MASPSRRQIDDEFDIVRCYDFIGVLACCWSSGWSYCLEEEAHIGETFFQRKQKMRSSCSNSPVLWRVETLWLVKAGVACPSLRPDKIWDLVMEHHPSCRWCLYASERASNCLDLEGVWSTIFVPSFFSLFDFFLLEQIFVVRPFKLFPHFLIEVSKFLSTTEYLSALKKYAGCP